VPSMKSQASLESFPVGAAEIAQRLGVRGQTVHTWRQRKLMPPPRWTVSGQPAWDWNEIEEWARRTGRLRARDVHSGLAELEGMGWEGDLEAMRGSRVPPR
jgi:predicted DNA-binding transcriptional regulator AlpA